MNQVILVDVHSIVDVITNSSTELFLCSTSKMLDAVKKLLEIEWAKFIKKNPAKYDFVHEGKRTYERNRKSVWEVLYVKQGLTETDKKMLEEGHDSYGWRGSVKPKTIVIHSTGTNSIPGDFMDVIESEGLFGTVSRWHLG